MEIKVTLGSLRRLAAVVRAVERSTEAPVNEPQSSQPSSGIYLVSALKGDADESLKIRHVRDGT